MDASRELAERALACATRADVEGLVATLGDRAVVRQ
jgi:hypothetical protein